jgi:hypothetical protein
MPFSLTLRRGVPSKGNGNVGAARSALRRPHEDAGRGRLRRMDDAPCRRPILIATKHARISGTGN